jgi:nicotinamide-nucleotide adenylyltransferase
MQELQHAVYSLTQLFTLYDLVETLDATASPTAWLVVPPQLPRVQHIGLCCGSFNPLTCAHTTLAMHAHQTFSLDNVFFTLAKVTINKEQVTGLGLVDRLLLLALYAAQHTALGVALVNRGLYVEQAQAFRALFGEHVKLSFLIGMDKLFQILDPRYYHDREAALQQLFSLASLCVANRGDMDEQSFTQLLEQPENQPFRKYVHFFTLPADITEVSATAARSSLSRGQGVDGLVPAEVSTGLAEMRAYAPPLRIADDSVDAYAVRQQLLTALYTVRSWAEHKVDFRRLLTLALSASDQGRALRQATDREEIVPLIRSCIQARDT